MIDDEEQNVDDVRPIKLDTIIPNKITLNITKLTNNNLSQSILTLISVSQSLISLIVVTSPVSRMRMRAPCLMHHALTQVRVTECANNAWHAA